MKRLALLAAVAAAVCAGCTSVTRYKGVNVESDSAGKVVRRVESESVTQTDTTTKELKLKYIEF